MHFIYFGTGYFSHLVLEGLLASGCCPELVVTQPDRPKGRGMAMAPSLVAELAQKHAIETLKPSVIKDEAFLAAIKGRAPDFILVADYGKILPQALLDIPSRLSFAVHPSLLPKYRGATPLNRPIINGEHETGVTIFKMAASMDSGAIIAKEAMALKDDDTLLAVTHALAAAGARLAAKVLTTGEFTLTPQDDTQATYAAKFIKEDGLIDWGKNPKQIVDFIRGTAGWPSAYTFYKGKKIQILKASVVAGSSASLPGGVIAVNQGGIDVGAGGSVLRILEVKPEGKGVMSAYAFACGHHVQVGTSLGAESGC